MKKQAAERANKAATYMSSVFGWGSASAAAGDQQPQAPEEVKVSANEGGIIEEETKN